MILALDTSGGELLACLLDAALVLLRAHSETGARHQERIIEVVEDLLGGRGGALEAIAVVRGPGSQTGLRVGLATAAGLAFARRTRLVPLSSLAVAAQRLVLDGDGIAAVSAGRSNVYAQAFEAAGPRRTLAGARVRCPVAEVHARLNLPPSLAVAAEPRVRAGAANALPAGALRGGAEALAAATREAVGAGVGVAYDGLAGDYGD